MYIRTFRRRSERSTRYAIEEAVKYFSYIIQRRTLSASTMLYSMWLFYNLFAPNTPLGLTHFTLLPELFLSMTLDLIEIWWKWQWKEILTPVKDWHITVQGNILFSNYLSYQIYNIIKQVAKYLCKNILRWEVFDIILIKKFENNYLIYVCMKIT